MCLWRYEMLHGPCFRKLCLFSWRRHRHQSPSYSRHCGNNSRPATSTNVACPAILGGNLHITLAQLGLRVEIQESNLSCDIGTGILMNSRWFSAGLPYNTNQSTWVFDNVKQSWRHGVRCPLEPSVRIPGGWWHLQRNWSDGPAIPWNSGKLSYCASMSHTKYIIPAWSVVTVCKLILSSSQKRKRTPKHLHSHSLPRSLPTVDGQPGNACSEHYGLPIGRGSPSRIRASS